MKDFLSKKEWLIDGLLLLFEMGAALFWAFQGKDGVYALGGCLIFGVSLLGLVALALLRRYDHRVWATPFSQKKLGSFLSAAFSTPEKRLVSVRKALALAMFVLFLVRFYLAHDYLEDVVALSSTFMTSFETLLSALTTNWEIGAMLFVLLYEFVPSDVTLLLSKAIATPVSVITLLCYPLYCQGIVGEMVAGNSYPRSVLMVLELALTLLLESEALIHPFQKKKSWIAYVVVVGLVLLVLDNLSDYLPKNLFGEGVGNLAKPDNFNEMHRFFLYLSFLLPVLYFALLFPFDKKDRRALLFFIAEATFFSYASIRRIETFQSVEALPLHLCNTAMYIMPLTLLWTNYVLFYFTVFVNVIGAFLAMLMPKMVATNLAFSNQTFEFFTNHMYAFFMPMLIMLLGIYERPKFKYYLYSMAGFLVYFVGVLSINIYQTAIGHPTDFFFLNYTDIVDKLGDWAKAIYTQSYTLTSSDRTYLLRPLYWFLFYLTYAGLSLLMWYVYEVIFLSVDQLIFLRGAREKDRRSKDAYYQAHPDKKGEATMDLAKVKAAEASLSVQGLEKKYPSAAEDAVCDLSFSLTSGKIYGFLGKNGAGKSTTIKSIVGIQGYDKGTIDICGFDQRYSPLEAKMCLGFVPDNYALYENLTGKEYIDYLASVFRVTREEKEAVIPSLLSKLEMTDVYSQPMSSYSHGMKQKITIIGALVHQPKIWILDEPMTGLDPSSIFQVKELMKDYAKAGNIVFFSSHIIDLVKNLCDEVIIIDKGHFLEAIDFQKEPARRETLEKEFLALTEGDKAK
jgi:ABC-2 type transport system ATP-binding protein